MDEFLEAEDVEDFTPDWSAIDTDARTAVAFRELLRRRARWAHAYEQCFGTFSEEIKAAYRHLLGALPDGCWEDSGEEGSAFTVPLLSLLEQPAKVIERFMRMPYEDAPFRLDLFKRLREHLERKLLLASGFPPDTNADEVASRIVMPTRYKGASTSELVHTYLGGTPFADILNHPIPFRVPDEARFEHCHVIGGTGHGKTQLLQRMIHADLIASQKDGRSVVVIDSQGDLIERLVRLDLFDPDTPRSLAERLILIDPADVEFPPSLNLFDAPSHRLDGYSPADRERALNGLIELYETFFGALLGAELTQKQGVIFRYLARLMLAIPGATIHTLMQIMEDGKPFRSHMDSLDGSARYFFETEFFHPSFSATKKQILKRLWGVLSTPAFERMFAQRENKVDLFEATNGGSIVLINTAKDLLKTEGSALLGRFFISMLAQATLERSAIDPDERTPTLVYVDEAQEYFDDTIETILSQARKYKVGMTLAHQTLDQLSPRLRSAFLSNTSLKCAGGVSNKDARALAGELHTSSEFIEGMKKRRERTEFALWLKHRTPEALRLDVPLGFLERQPTLAEEQYDELLRRNRERYCGTRADILAFERAEATGPEAAIAPTPEGRSDVPQPPIPQEPELRPSPPRPPRPKVLGTGKGGPKHRYLQSLIKELGEQQGFRATLEAPLPEGGQVDAVLERDGMRIAFEVSVSTPVEQERHNLEKCLAAGFSRVALVLAKSKATQGRYRAAVAEGLTPDACERLSMLTPEEVADYIASLAPPPAPSEMLVKGWKVKVSHAAVSPEDARERRDRLARLVARSLGRSDEE